VKIEKDRVVAIRYTIRNAEGSIVDSSEGREPLTYLHGYQQIVPGVEQAVDGLEEGTELTLDVEPRDAYGDRDPTAVLVMPRTAFPDDEELEPGTMFRAYRPDGRPFIFSVIEVTGDRVVVDANHPLAGQKLSIDVAVITVREATEQEVAHGHVHPHGGASDSTLPA
jgi:FKBP-type peptidyl-prolyl cis-trans isomerase SlyD